MIFNIFFTLAFLLCLVHSQTTPNLPQAKPNCTTPFCATCVVPAICEACDAHYYLNSNICTSCTNAIPNCTNCTFNEAKTKVECSQCDLGHYSQDLQSCKLCSNDVTNCLTCTNDGNTTTCSVCFDTYFLSAPNTCTPCDANIPHCFLCDSISIAPFEICSQCQDNYILDNSGKCIACRQKIKMCIYCDSTTKSCDTCVDGYFRKTSGAFCAPCTDLIYNCASCVDLDDAGTSITCSKCQTDTYLVGNACVTCGNFITGCTTCNPSNNTCDACSIGLFRSGSGVSCDLCDAKITSCASCDATDDAGLIIICNSCFQNTFLKDNICVACELFITGCINCTTCNSTCDTCATGNFRDSQGTQCSKCESRITGCATCAATDDTATTVTCSACTAGLYLINNQCVTCPNFITGCTVCNSVNNTCDTCALGGYRKGQGKACETCSSVIANCVECITVDDAGLQVACMKCAPNTFTIGNTCQACAAKIPFCDTCDIANVSCITCSVGYYMANNGQTCGPCNILSCSKCVALEELGFVFACTACIDNFFLVNKHCQSCLSLIPQCDTCASQAVCTTCRDSHYATMDGYDCRSCSEIANCVSCQNNGQDAASCTACNSTLKLFVSKDNACVSCSSIITDCDQCLQEDSTLQATCKSCGNGKVLADDKLSCQDSSSSTIIIIAAVVGGAAILVAGTIAFYVGFAIFKRMKKRKQSLLEDDYEKI